jgi:hypothetical protein
METNIYDYVIDQLAKHKGKWRIVAIESGVSRRTIEKIARKEVTNPGIHHVQALADYFKREIQ